MNILTLYGYTCTSLFFLLYNGIELVQQLPTNTFLNFSRRLQYHILTIKQLVSSIICDIDR